MKFKQGEMEMLIMNLQNQIEEKKVSYKHGVDISNEYIKQLNEKHEEQNKKKILKIIELEDRIVELEDQLEIKNIDFSKKNSIQKNEISNLNKGISRINGIIKQLKNENEKLLKKDEDKKKNLAGLTKTFDKAKEEIEELKLEVRKLNKAVDRKSKNIIQIRIKTLTPQQDSKSVGSKRPTTIAYFLDFAN